MKPVFLAEIPAGTYHLRFVEDPLGTPVNHDIDLVIPARCYAIPDASHASSAWKVLVDALDTSLSSTGAVAFTVQPHEGWRVSLTYPGGTNLRLDYVNSSTADDGRFDPRWLGMPAANVTATGLGAFFSVMPPTYSWFPKCNFGDRDVRMAWVPVSTTGRTADGTTFGVNQSDGTLQRYSIFRSVGGIRAARISQNDLQDSYLDYKTQAGIGSSLAQTWHALDGTDGWWHRTVAGIYAFRVFRDERDLDSDDGNHVIVYDDDTPVDMSGWRRLAGLSPHGNAGKTSNITFCALRL